LLALKETMMFVRLKMEDAREGLVATISQRNDDGKITGRPSIFSSGTRKKQNKEREQWREAWG
jgi:hypothetical protein